MMRVKWCMKAHSLTLAIAAVVAAFAMFATPAEAGGRYRNYYDGCHRGGHGYYRPYYRAYYRPYHRVYYRPYYRGYGYYRGPAFYLAIPPVRIAIGGGGYWR